MGLLDQLLQSDAQIIFGNPDDFAEPIVYTPFVAGVAQAAIHFNAVVYRPPPRSMAEDGVVRVRQLDIFIPNDPIGKLGTLTCSIEDTISVPWRIGDAASLFRVKERTDQDTGGWMVVAESSAL